MLSHLKLTNFKAWKSTGQLGLAPLTLLFGTNSSGKSSLIQSMLLLRQTMRSTNPNIDLNFGRADAGDSAVLGVFADVLCQHAEATEVVRAKQIGIELGWRGPFESDESGVFSAVYDEGGGGSAALVSLRLGRGAQAFAVHRARHGSYKLFVSDRARAIGASPAFRPRQSFALSSAAADAMGARAAALLAAGQSMVDELGRITYLGPVRRLAQRDYVWTGHLPGSIGDDGAGTVDALVASSIAREAARRRGLQQSSAGQLVEDAGRWLSLMGLAEGLAARRLGQSARYELHVLENGGASNLKDVGVGVSQVLPVIVSALFAQAGDIVIVEEPESHLHPMAQTQLAELFIQASRDRGVQFIIESHSEHLLLRLQRRVAERGLRADSVAMYFLKKTEGQAHIERLQLNEAGDIANWPENFFGDDMSEIAARTIAAIEQDALSDVRRDGEP